MFSTGERGRFALAMHSFRCPLMGWSGRALAPPASEPCQGRQSQGARYVSATQHDDRRDWYRYRQELVPRCGSRSVRCHCAAAEVVTWPGGITVCQHAALPDRDGGLRRIPGTLISRSQPTSRWAMASISPDKASITGLVVFAASIVGLWLCSPGKDGKMKPFLRRGLDTWAGLAITVGFGIGIAMMIAGSVG